MNKGTALLRQQNEKRTLALLRKQPHISRQEIAKAMGVSKNTISLIIEKFLKEGVVKEVGAEDPGGVGRPRIQLSLVTEAYKAIGILIQNAFCQYVVTDYGSNILEEGQLPLNGNDAEEAIKTLIKLCESLLSRHPEVLGIGLAVPALVDPVEGVVHFSSHLNWREVPLKARLDEALPVKSLVLNIVKASAIAPSSVVPPEALSNSFYLRIDEGVGGAHIVDSRIYSGASWSAGEIGHLPVRADGPLCSCGQRGCLETLVSLPAIRGRILHEDPRAGLDGSMLDEWDPEAELDAAMDKIIRESGEYVGTAVSQIITLLNPKYVVIDSPFEKLETFRNAVKASVESRALKYPLHHTSLLFVANAYSSSIGAAFAVILDFEKE
ncbi:ROK family transcriptional regulator [Paenibacillus filicis]|uniref:ROK family transcriptional regulator n=1 Tax=Paenibacillus gyeongsangnamensis TaxID=3388067 RepID=A0ABT4Q7G0_9BACL|nr:ROK family transcriptional regulator [Paenibacillus filicis]MCZ8512722.1 ROK family transcriptional regulator [Paenibacillus filicis]